MQTRSHSSQSLNDNKSSFNSHEINKNESDESDDENEGYEEGQENPNDWFHRKEGFPTVLIREMTEMNKINKDGISEMNKINKDAIFWDRLFNLGVLSLFVVFALIISLKGK